MKSFLSFALTLLIISSLPLNGQSQDLLNMYPVPLPKAKVNQLLLPDLLMQINIDNSPELQHRKDSIKLFTYEDPNNPTCRLKSFFEYNDWGQTILKIEYADGEFHPLRPWLVDVYSYNNQGLLITDSSFYWDNILEEWQPGGLIEYEYNDAGKEILALKYLWDYQSDEFVFYDKTETFYNANNDPLIVYRSIWDTQLDIWLNSIQDEYSYNSNNSILTKVILTWDAGIQDWAYYKRESYEYNSEGKNTTIVYNWWESMTSFWMNVLKSEISYNSKGLKEVKEDFSWDLILSQWEPALRNEFLYYDDGSLYADNVMPWDEGMGAFLIANQNRYKYDSYGNQVSVTNDTVDKVADEMVLCNEIFTYYQHLYQVVEYDIICDNDSLEWRGTYLKTEGIHEQSYISVQGYDSLYTMYLFTEPSPGPFSIMGDESAIPGQVSVYTAPVDLDLSYAWAIGNGTRLSFPDANSVEVEWGDADEGYVWCVSVGQNDCFSGEMELIVDIHGTAVEEDLSERISFFPNPVQSTLHLNIPDPLHMKRILLFDVLGKPVLQSRVTGGTMSLELNQLRPGVYILKLEGEKSFTYRIIKQ